MPLFQELSRIFPSVCRIDYSRARYYVFYLLVSCFPAMVQADEQGAVQIQSERHVPDLGDGLVIQGQPERVVVLEYSFLDAVILAGISPVGVADDQKPDRILPQLKQQMAPYQSVGLRGQPNLETIASLKPDLIIADKQRHSSIYRELQEIAPVLLLLSYGAEYHNLLDDALLIGQALGKESAVQKRLQSHQQTMDHQAEILAEWVQPAAQDSSGHERFLFATASARGVAVHASKAFATGVMKRLGLETAIPKGDDNAYLKVSFEQMAGMNPDWLLIGDYNQARGGSETLKRWQAHPLWPMLTVAAKQQMKQVDPKVWSLSRGIYAAEQVAEDLIHLVSSAQVAHRE